MKIRTKDKKVIDNLFKKLKNYDGELGAYGITSARIAKNLMEKGDSQEMYIKLYNYIFNKYEKLSKKYEKR